MTSRPKIRRPFATLLYRVEDITEERHVVLRPMACFFYNLAVREGHRDEITVAEADLLKRYAPAPDSQSIAYADLVPTWYGFIILPKLPF